MHKKQDEVCFVLYEKPLSSISKTPFIKSDKTLDKKQAFNCACDATKEKRDVV